MLLYYYCINPTIQLTWLSKEGEEEKIYSMEYTEKQCFFLLDFFLQRFLPFCQDRKTQ